MPGKSKRVESVKAADLVSQICELKKRVALLEDVIDGFPGGIVLTDAEMNVLICNRYQRDLQGYPDHLFSAGKLKLADLLRFNEANGEYRDVNSDALIATKLDFIKNREAHYFERTRPNGNVIEVRGVPLENGCFVTCHTDVTENRQHQAQIADLALTDPLTGLANRRLLLDHFQQAAGRARRGTEFAIHYLDLDYFKPVNDRLGHKAGDAVLVEIAKRLKDVTRETDTVARIGGDEFIILQSDLKGETSAKRLAARLVSAISKPIAYEDTQLGVTASVGISLSTKHPPDLEEMMRQADLALYQSKKNGRNCASVHSGISTTA